MRSLLAEMGRRLVPSEIGNQPHLVIQIQGLLFATSSLARRAAAATRSSHGSLFAPWRMGEGLDASCQKEPWRAKFLHDSYRPHPRNRQTLNPHSCRKATTSTPAPIKTPLQAAARLAQSVERETLIHSPHGSENEHLKVVGSTPTSGSIPDGDVRRRCFFLLLSLSRLLYVCLLPVYFCAVP